MPQTTVDVVPLGPGAGPAGVHDPLRARLDDLLTRAFYSAAGYVFESDPWVVAADSDVLTILTSIREDDRRHAHVLGTLIQSRGGVPQPGVFPWWNLDLNYLTVPCLARFVVETLDDELPLYAALLDLWPHDDPAGRATVDWVRTDKAEHLAKLRPAAEAALVREAETYRAEIAALKTRRAAKQAKAKAAADAAKKAKAAAKAPAGAKPAAAAPAAAAGPVLRDPKEPGISPKERGRRMVLQSRNARGLPLSLLAGAAPAGAPAAAVAAAGGAAPAFPGAVPPAAGGPLPDPNEPGITPKEKARRQMLKMRAAAGGPSAGPAPGAAAGAAPIVDGGGGAPPPAAVELLDPNEPGITPKERARRQMLKMRAAAGGGGTASPASSAAAPAPEAAPAAPAAAASAPAGPAVPDDLGDPDEPGISPKERGRRQVVRNRRKAAGL